MDDMKENIKELIDESYEVDIKLGKSMFGRLNSDEIADHLLKNGVYAFPCKVNDPVWENIYSDDGIYRHTLKVILVGFHIGVIPNRPGSVHDKYLVLYSTTYDNTYYRELGAVGDTIFFSQEEAHAHRKRRR